MDPHRRLPISARRAFALAFDLAVRRDAVQSLCVPLLLHAPWLLASALLPALSELDRLTGRMVLAQSAVMVGDAFIWLWVGAMLRFRARSVFNRPAGAAPARVMEGYARGFGRVPWLYLTEFVRYAVIFLGSVFLFFPGIWLSFRLSMATESVVLRERGTLGAFRYSFHVTDGRLERWLEMIVISVMLWAAFPLLCVIGFLLTPATRWTNWVVVCVFLLVPVMSVIQYAWTNFYLRLEEIDQAGVAGSIPQAGTRAAGGAGAAGGSPTPRLRLIEGNARGGHERG